MRSFLRIALAIFAASLLAPAPSAAQAPAIKVTLLGTGGPQLSYRRSGISTLVEAGGQKFIFDVGRGAIQRLDDVKVRWSDVSAVFFTHLHSDHVVGFPDLWLTGWITSRRTTPVMVRGPRGTARMMSLLEQAYDFDIRIRLYDTRPPVDGVVLLAQDFEEGLVYDRGGVKITAFEVDHSPVRPAFGYRVDYAGRSVVLSGDTKVSENLIKHAQGVDLLVHEVAVLEALLRQGTAPALAKDIADHHVTPEQAGQVFARTRPRIAVYSHYVPVDVSEADLIPATRKTYPSGALEVGEDLMVIEVGDKVEVRRPVRPAP